MVGAQAAVALGGEDQKFFWPLSGPRSCATPLGFARASPPKPCGSWKTCLCFGHVDGVIALRDQEMSSSTLTRGVRQQWAENNSH